MDQWTELAWEAERDEADAYQAAADAAEGERLRAALASSGPERDADWGPLAWAVRLDGIR